MADLYGSDVSTFAGPGGTPDIDPLLPPITGPRVVLERVARRLITPRGSMPEAPLYGYAIQDQLARRMRPVDRERMKNDIVQEAEKEPGVKSATVAELSKVGAGKFRMRLSIQLAEGPFALVLSVDQVTVALLSADSE